MRRAREKKKMRKPNILAGQMACLSLFLLLSSSGLAQAVSISVAPVRIEHNVPAGENVTEAISIANDDTLPVHIRVKIEDWTLTQDGAVSFAPGGTHPLSAASWIKVNPREFDLGSGQSQDVRYSLTVPKDAAPGGYRAAIVFATVPRPKPGEREKRVMLEGRIATILYETLGRPVPSGEITNVSFKVSPEGEPEFLIAFQNTGKVHVRLHGGIQVRDKEGKEFGKAPLPDVPVLPQSARDIKVAFEGKLPPGEYVAEVLMDIGRRELLSGERKFSIGQ
jgi:P pilus assembly chaperone PapD